MEEMPSLDWAKIRLGLFADPKVRRLFSQQDEMTARAAMGLWLDVVLSSWSAEERVAASELWLDDETGGILDAALAAVGLLDEGSRIPQTTWEKWWGSVEERRASERARKQKWRAQQSPDVPRDTMGHHGTDRDGAGTSPSPSLSNSGGEGSVRGEDPRDPLVEAAVVALGVLSPSPKAMAWIDELAGDHGIQPTVAALMEAHMEGGSAKVISRAEGMLKLRALESQRAEAKLKADETAEARRHREARRRAELAQLAAGAGEPKPLRELMPDVAQLLGKQEEST